MRSLQQSGYKIHRGFAKKAKAKRFFLLPIAVFSVVLLLSQSTKADNRIKTPVPGENANPGLLKPIDVIMNNSPTKPAIKSEVMSIPASAFQWVNTNTVTSYDVTTGGISFSGAGVSAVLVAPLLLPQAAQISSIECYALDVTDADLVCRVVAYDHLPKNVGIPMATVTTSGSSSSGVKSWPFQVKNSNIQNDKFSYAVECRLNKTFTAGNLFLICIVVKYTYNTGA